jgi:hypothetical protein
MQVFDQERHPTEFCVWCAKIRNEMRLSKAKFTASRDQGRNRDNSSPAAASMSKVTHVSVQPAAAGVLDRGGEDRAGRGDQPSESVQAAPGRSGTAAATPRVKKQERTNKSRNSTAVACDGRRNNCDRSQQRTALRLKW